MLNIMEMHNAVNAYKFFQPQAMPELAGRVAETQGAGRSDDGSPSRAVEVSISQEAVVKGIAAQYDPASMGPREARNMSSDLVNLANVEPREARNVLAPVVRSQDFRGRDRGTPDEQRRDMREEELDFDVFETWRDLARFHETRARRLEREGEMEEAKLQERLAELAEKFVIEDLAQRLDKGRQPYSLIPD
jgi:hypothetical protein